MTVDPGADLRVDPPISADESTTVLAFLRYQRETLEMKCAGLGAAELARQAVPPSALSLLGLLRHMAEVERNWFRRVMADEDAPPIFYTEADRDGDFQNVSADPVLVEQAWQAWRNEVAFAESITAREPDLGVLSRGAHRRFGHVSLRWVLNHMLEEYARHNGHADLLRETIDGVVGE